MEYVEAAGARIPALGFGTWQLRDDECRRLVERALEVGYRHIDTAEAYGNEAEVGAAIRGSGLRRDEVFLTTKIWPDHFRPAELKHAAAERLHRLGLDRVDLLLLHWPSPDVPLQDTIEALNDVKDMGLTSHIGVSNFTAPLVEAAQTVSRAQLTTNQVEYHPFLDQSRLLQWMRAKGLSLTAYCPLARGKIANDPVIKGVADKHGKTPAQVTLRWLVQQPEVIAIPRTSNPARVVENFEIFDFALDDADMTAITGLGTRAGRMVAMEGYAPDWEEA